MPELRSALANHLRPGRFGAAGETPLVLSERPLGVLMQLSGWRDSFARAVEPLLARLGLDGAGSFDRAQSSDKALAFRIAPERLLLRVTADAWAEAEGAIDAAETPVLDLGHSRTLVRVAGATAPDLMALLMPIDFDGRAFAPGRFVQSGMHSVAVLVHRAADEGGAPVFDIYMPRSFAASLWAYLTQTAMPLGYRVDAGA